jgi:chemotaxis protein histidine kinase CheA
MSERPTEIIHVPNKLSAKLKGRLAIDPAKLEKAQAIVASLAADYLPRLAEEARQISARWKEGAQDDAALHQLHKAAHDIKGQGTTFGYPLATEVAAALCRLFKPEILAQPMARNVIEAHIAALVAIAAEQLAGDGGPVGKVLVEGLRQTREKLGLDA